MPILPTNRYETWFSTAGAGALLGLTAACSSTPAPKTAADDATAASAALAPTPASKTAEETLTTVKIDDEILRACGIDANDAFFAYNSSRLGAGDSKPLAAVVKCFTSGPLKGRIAKLVGRADPRGEAEYNMVLGQSRAETVASYMMIRGLDRARVTSTSRGAEDATGTDESTWAHDRRVDIMLGGS